MRARCLLILLLLAVAAPLAGCVVAVPPVGVRVGAVWVPGHWHRWHWVPGHWG